MPYNDITFYNYGTAASTLLPTFFDVDDPALWWDPNVEVCEQTQYRDFTGVDSLSAFLTSILVFVGVQSLEHWLGRPLYRFPGLTPYRKDTGHEPATEKVIEADKAVEMEETTGSYSAGVAKDVQSSEEDSSGPEGAAEPAIDVGVPAEIEEPEYAA